METLITKLRCHLAAMSSCALLLMSTFTACTGTPTSAGPAEDAQTPMGDASSAATFEPCTPPPDGKLPSDVFCIGLYRNHDATKYESTAIPYTPGVTLWSDGADKQRYLQLPAMAQIDTTNMDVWKFPAGTKAFKEFRFDGKLVETRLFWKQENGEWLSGTYIWDSAQTAAPLNMSSKPVLLDSGYEIPTNKDCGKCHHGGADYLLGVEAVALALPTAKGITLASLVKDGRLNKAPSQTAITLPEDETGKAGAPLGFLHANCGMPCHSNRGLGHETELLLRLRADEFWSASGSVKIPDVKDTDTFKATNGQQPTTASVAQAFPGAARITPGSHDKSVIWQLANTRGKYQMPPLVSHKVDDASMQKLADWIDSLLPQ